MSLRFLIDECLSPDRVRLAVAAGHVQSSHVVWMGLTGRKDWELTRIATAGDWTFVTKNSVDFRGSPARPGTKGHYSNVPIHNGLVCLNATAGMDLDMQLELFEQALRELARDGDLVNKVLEISLEGEEFRIQRYSLPPDE